jgi:hypothetical protein
LPIFTATVEFCEMLRGFVGEIEKDYPSPCPLPLRGEGGGGRLLPREADQA